MALGLGFSGLYLWTSMNGKTKQFLEEGLNCRV